MKTRAQKEQELAKARELFAKSESLIFADFTNITAENLRKLRIELKKADASLLVIKKRILSILLKEKGIDVDLAQYKTSVGTIFSEVNGETIAGPAFRFFSGMEIPEGAAKDVWIKKILAGYDINTKAAMDAAQIIYIGKLPPREILLAQFLGMLASPIRSFLYVLDQKAKQGGASASPEASVAESAAADAAPAAAAPAKAEASTPTTEAAPASTPAASDTKSDSSDTDTDPEQKVELTQAQ
jgi:large subunit ribosomal protein L10